MNAIILKCAADLASTSSSFPFKKDSLNPSITSATLLFLRTQPDVCDRKKKKMAIWLKKKVCKTRPGRKTVSKQMGKEAVARKPMKSIEIH